ALAPRQSTARLLRVNRGGGPAWIDGPMRARSSSSDLLVPRDATLVEALVEAAGLDAPFATFHGTGAPRRFDARAALRRTLRWASALRQAGVKSREAVAIMLPTSEDFVGAFFGALWIGAVPLP